MLLTMYYYNVTVGLHVERSAQIKDCRLYAFEGVSSNCSVERTQHCNQGGCTRMASPLCHDYDKILD